MKKPTAMLLRADFDIDQTGDALEWRFSRKDGDGNPIHGRYAGQIYFTVGEKMRLQVRAGSMKPFKGFTVKDCCLISRPGVVEKGPRRKTVWAPPSPFVGSATVAVNGATIDLPAGQFIADPTLPAEPGYFEVAQVWDNELVVGESTGSWDLSLVMTVNILLDDGSSYDRVLYLDPESEVGAGTSPPH